MSRISAVLLGPADAATALRAVRALEDDGVEALSPPAAGDVVLLTGAGGPAERLRALRDIAGAGASAPIVVVMPARTGNAALRKALLAGASGIVLDDALEHALTGTVRGAAGGQLVVPAGMLGQIAPRPLSHREREVLELATGGSTNRQIAARLFLAESTVKSHLASAFTKLDVGSRAEAAALARPAEDRLAGSR